MSITLNDLSPNQIEALKTIERGENIAADRLWEQLWDLGLIDAISTEPEDPRLLRDILTDDGRAAMALIHGQVQP